MAGLVESNTSNLRASLTGDRNERLLNLMNALRERDGRQRPWTDFVKILKNSLNDQRVNAEVRNKVILSKHVQSILSSVKSTTLKSVLGRLEAMCKNLGLKYSCSAGSIIIRSEMFYVQILMDNIGRLHDVKLAFNSDPKSCPEMAECLAKRNLDDFEVHINGLVSVCQVSGDSKLRGKATLALQGLENDLKELSNLQSSSSVTHYIHKSPLGIVIPRCGGKPMELTYFVGPYDLLNTATKKPFSMNVESIVDNKLGYGATVGIENSNSGAKKIQTMQLICYKENDGRRTPSFATVSNANGCLMAAVFVLRLRKPVPMSLASLRAIAGFTGIEMYSASDLQSLVSLIAQQHDQQPETNIKTLLVNLPDQRHQYCLTRGDGGSASDIQGVLVSKIPFTHPSSVPKIICCLRQQILFNTLLGSCFRASSPALGLSGDSCPLFDVIIVSQQQFSVNFEHPLVPALCTAEFDMSDVTNVDCKIFSSSDRQLCTNEHASKAAQRSLSIPVTMRAILKEATEELRSKSKATSTTTQLSAEGSMRRRAFSQLHRHQPGALHASICSSTSTLPYSGSMEPITPGPETPTSAGFDPRVAKTPMLASLLDVQSATQAPVAEQRQSMLSALLEDKNGGQSTQQPMLAGDPTGLAMAAGRGRGATRGRKRRSTNDVRSPGAGSKSPKARATTPDLTSFQLMNTSPGCGVAVPTTLRSPMSAPPMFAVDPQQQPLAPQQKPPESPLRCLKSSLDFHINRQEAATATPPVGSSDDSSCSPVKPAIKTDPGLGAQHRLADLLADNSSEKFLAPIKREPGEALKVPLPRRSDSAVPLAMPAVKCEPPKDKMAPVLQRTKSHEEEVKVERKLERHFSEESITDRKKTAGKEKRAQIAISPSAEMIDLAKKQKLTGGTSPKGSQYDVTEADSEVNSITSKQSFAAVPGSNSVSPRAPSTGLKRANSSSNILAKEKKKKPGYLDSGTISSDNEALKRKREDKKETKEKAKKRKIYDFPESDDDGEGSTDYGSTSSSSSKSNLSIKIRTQGGQMKIQKTKSQSGKSPESNKHKASSSPNIMRQPGSTAPSNKGTIFKTKNNSPNNSTKVAADKLEKAKSNAAKLKAMAAAVSASSKPPVSMSSSKALTSPSVASKSPSSLQPKHGVSSATAKSQNQSALKSSAAPKSSPVAPPKSKPSSSAPGNQRPSSKTTPPPKQRKGSINAVIDKLTHKQLTPEVTPQRKDPMAQADLIRQQILRQASDSTPDIMSKMPSFKKVSSEAAKAPKALTAKDIPSIPRIPLGGPKLASNKPPTGPPDNKLKSQSTVVGKLTDKLIAGKPEEKQRMLTEGAKASPRDPRAKAMLPSNRDPRSGALREEARAIPDSSRISTEAAPGSPMSQEIASPDPEPMSTTQQSQKFMSEAARPCSPVAPSSPTDVNTSDVSAMPTIPLSPTVKHGSPDKTVTSQHSPAVAEDLMDAAVLL